MTFLPTLIGVGAGIIILEVCTHPCTSDMGPSTFESKVKTLWNLSSASTQVQVHSRSNC